MQTPNETQKQGPVKARSAEGALTERSPLETVGLVAGVIGLTAVIFSFVLYALDPAVLSLSVANAVFGLAGIALYMATNRRSLGRVFAGRSTGLVLLEGMIVVGLLGAMGVANYFAAQNPKEWDLTRDNLFTLHEQSMRVAKELDKKVTVYAFFRTTEPARGVLTQAVDLYRQHTNNLELVFVNPDAPPQELVEKYDLNSKSPRIVVAAENGQFAKLRTATEEGLTNALIKVAERPAKKVYFLTGHQEPSIEDQAFEEGFAMAASNLRTEGFEVSTLSLLERENVPADASVVIVAGAATRLFPNEVESLKAWLDRGGRVAFLLEPGIELGLERIFRPYGVEVGNDLVIEPNPAAKAFGFGPDSPVVQTFEAHPITNKLRGGATLFHRARSVQPKVGLANLEVVTLIRTGASSWGETRLDADPALDEDDVPGPVPIAVAVVRNTAAHPNKLDDEARMVVFGDHHFANNRFSAMSANADLFLNAVTWLAGDEDRITIRPKTRKGDRLPLTETQQTGIVFFSVNLLPLLIVGLGFSVWAVRRRK